MAHYALHPPKGEIVLLVGPPAAAPTDAIDADALLRDELQLAKPSQAAAKVAKLTGLDRKALYARALELK
jgi:16S rRNA (cytidine1402-2'-O)-methyltransferase